MFSRLKKILLIIILLTLKKIIYFSFGNKIINLINYKKNKEIFPGSNDQFKNIQKFVNIIFNGTLLDEKEFFSRAKNPKISVIISIYNGEAYLKTALLSIQNQDFKDIEIIMIDDASKDNSVSLIRQLMVKEKRIILH